MNNVVNYSKIIGPNEALGSSFGSTIEGLTEESFKHNDYGGRQTGNN